MLWNHIETAPKTGDEILGYREDCGIIIMRWASAVEFMTSDEIEQSRMTDEELHEPDWFAADFISGCRMEGAEVPTHWASLPQPPKT